MASVRHIPCAPYVNESERLAVERIKVKLQSLSNNQWVILSNLNHSSNPSHSSDEIDLVVIGPTGISVIEVKHWDSNFLKQHSHDVEREAEKLNSKVKRIVSKIRGIFDPGYLSGKFLLTRGEVRFAQQRPEFRGSKFFGLPEIEDLLETKHGISLSVEQVINVARVLEPQVRIALNGDLRNFGALINLERISPKSDAFHRIYRGQHSTRRERVVLHLYDLSASDDQKSEDIARREFEVVQCWQKASFVPCLLDSFQEADGYPGELFYFSLVDPTAPQLAQRQKDPSWTIEDRLRFAVQVAKNLHEFHSPQESELKPIIHRRISPFSLRVRQNGNPLFTDFSVTRIDGGETVSSIPVELGELAQFVAPEIRDRGWAAADARSDVYSLCASLRPVFSEKSEKSKRILSVLDSGLTQKIEDRVNGYALSQALEEISSPLTQQIPSSPVLSDPDFWDEDTIVPFQNSRYKIIGSLGKGGIGQTFKVVEVDAYSEDLFGTYVAKVIRNGNDADQALRAYRRARAYTTHPHLSAIYEIAPEWQPRCFVALLKWVEGRPLDDYRGVLEIHAEELGELSPELLAIRWLTDLCSALSELHTHGLVHGDISPKNIIVKSGTVVLTDYDTVTISGERNRNANPKFASNLAEKGNIAHPGDDIFSLAVTFFYVIFDISPFMRDSERKENLGLNWEKIDVSPYPLIKLFFDQATSPKLEERFRDANQALLALETLTTSRPLIVPQGIGSISHFDPPRELSKQRIKWLNELLAAYPGSRHGNMETRGLDSEFAVATYVETQLDLTIKDQIQNASVELVILFGNAGDGKTAFLQHLLEGLGLKKPLSSQRVSEQRLPDGRMLLVNLDGSAAWNGTGANELLSNLFRPFMNGEEQRDRVHIVAVNSGKLFEWLDEQDDTVLTKQLKESLQGTDQALNPRHRLIDLNRRSLVGGINQKTHEISTDFLDSLLKRMLGESEAEDPWISCSSCISQHRCTARQSVIALKDIIHGPIIRRRLIDALQACHQRGEIHITARELRSALSFIFFGVNNCDEIHELTSLSNEHFPDRVFDALSLQRQGELLQELARFDPALDSYPQQDRILIRHQSQTLPLSSLKRRAFFGWPDVNILEGTPPLPLAQGHHLDRFRRVPLMTDVECSDLLRQICRGISRLEDLPRIALERPDGVPLRITTRTPTESAFWVVKAWSKFRLEAPLLQTAEGLESLHTHLHLVYHGEVGPEERLLIGLELFHLLLDLADGVQLAGTAQEGAFANLKIFSQRLALEEARSLHAWHPAQPDQLNQIYVQKRGDRQWLLRENIQ